MESTQKYIEVEQAYELDEKFVDGIMDLASIDRVRVIRQLNAAVDSFTNDDENTQIAAGRIGGEMYYEIEYYKDEEMVILLDFSAIELDDYLDYMNEGKILLQ
jgi:DNA polymerase III delta prime subunit